LSIARFRLRETQASKARLNDAPPSPPWRAEKFSGGYVVRDATGLAVAYVYGRSTEDEAVEAKQMTMDEANDEPAARVAPERGDGALNFSRVVNWGGDRLRSE
jgi:hypothetical protein